MDAEWRKYDKHQTKSFFVRADFFANQLQKAMFFALNNSITI